MADLDVDDVADALETAPAADRPGGDRMYEPSRMPGRRAIMRFRNRVQTFLSSMPSDSTVGELLKALGSDELHERLRRIGDG